MPADALKCKECKTEYPLEARFVCERCFGPLEVSYTLPDADPAAIKRKIQAGPHTMWRYADFLPLAGPARCALPTGWTPLVKADRLAEQLGIKELYIKNETANPTHSFKDRVVSRRAGSCRELGFDTLACASTGNLANAVAAHAAAAGLPAYVLIPHDLEEPKVLATGAYGAHDRRRHGQLRRRQPALHRGLGRAAELGVREHQHAPVLRRGLQDARVRDRRAARLGAAGPRSSARSPPARSSRRSRAASRSSSTPAWSTARSRP